jgi:hypothetical protein
MKKEMNGTTLIFFSFLCKPTQFSTKILIHLSASAATGIGRIPKSCDDLHRIGHRKSGLFPVMGTKTVDNVYCDFTKPTNDPGK